MYTYIYILYIYVYIMYIYCIHIANIYIRILHFIFIHTYICISLLYLSYKDFEPKILVNLTVINHDIRDEG